MTEKEAILLALEDGRERDGMSLREHAAFLRGRSIPLATFYQKADELVRVGLVLRRTAPGGYERGFYNRSFFRKAETDGTTTEIRE